MCSPHPPSIKLPAEEDPPVVWHQPAWSPSCSDSKSQAPDLIVFQVENALYRVSKKILMDYVPLTELSDPKQSSNTGRDDDDAIILPDISISEMDNVLDIIWEHETSGHRIFRLEDLQDGLSLCLRRDLTFLKSHIIQRMQPLVDELPIIEKVDLATKHNIPAWLEDAYWELCLRPDALSYAEAQCLGLDRTVGIFRLRERLQSADPFYALADLRELLLDEPALHPPPLVPLPTRSLPVTKKVMRHTRHYIYDAICLVGMQRYPMRLSLFADAPDFFERFPECERSERGEPVVDLTSELDADAFSNFFAVLTDRDNWLGREDGYQCLASALDTAMFFGSQNARAVIIKLIEKLQPTPEAVELIRLAKKQEITSWLLPQYTLLCCRSPPLTSDEGERLGYATFAALCAIREKHCAHIAKLSAVCRATHVRSGVSHRRVDASDAPTLAPKKDEDFCMNLLKEVALCT